MVGPSIVLAGARCCGKTSVGKVIAERRNLVFIDADVLLTYELYKEGYKSISDFTAKNDWLEFRKRESAGIETICSIASHFPIVLALGGGAVANTNKSEEYIKRNCALLRNIGTGFYLIPSWDLEESARVLSERLVLDESSKSNRPAFSKKSPYEEMLDTLKSRDYMYREFAGDERYVVLTGNKTIKQVADTVLGLVV